MSEADEAAEFLEWTGLTPMPHRNDFMVWQAGYVKGRESQRREAGPMTTEDVTTAKDAEIERLDKALQIVHVERAQMVLAMGDHKTEIERLRARLKDIEAGGGT